MATKEPKRLRVIKGGPPKQTKSELEPVVCLLCRKKRGICTGDFIEIRTGGYWKKGRMVHFRKALICARCYVHDGHTEIIGYLN